MKNNALYVLMVAIVTAVVISGAYRVGQVSGFREGIKAAMENCYVTK